MGERGYLAVLVVVLLLLNNISFSLAQSEYNLTYDANGNLISGFDLNYGYNDFNQLVNISNNSGGLVAKYFYDHEGGRIKKVEYGSGGSNITTYYIGNDFIQIVNSSGVYNETYYYDENDLVAKKDFNGNKYFYHPDHLGSTTLVTNESGDIVEETFYLPYGDILSGGGSRYLFTGKEKDTETGLYYYGARYYNPFFRHFIQPDSEIKEIYNPQDLNRYTYTRNNPYKYVDPTGENPVLVAAGIAAGTAITMGVITGAITYHQTGDLGKSILAGEVVAITTLASVGLVYAAGTTAAGGLVYTGIEGVGKNVAVLTGLTYIGGVESVASQVLGEGKSLGEISYREVGVSAGKNMFSRFTPSTLKAGQDFPSQVGIPFLKEAGLQIGSNLGIGLVGEKLKDLVNQPNSETKKEGNQNHLDIKISVEEEREEEDDD